MDCKPTVEGKVTLLKHYFSSSVSEMGVVMIWARFNLQEFQSV